MDEIGQIIRNMLNAKKMTSAALGKLIGLNAQTIDNVIYGRSRKKSLLQKISSGLEVDLLYYTESKKSELENSYTELDLQLYNSATNVVIACVKNCNIYCTKAQLDLLIITLYEFLLLNKIDCEKTSIAFCKGMLEYAIKNHLLSYKSTQSSIGTKE